MAELQDRAVHLRAGNASAPACGALGGPGSTSTNLLDGVTCGACLARLGATPGEVTACRAAVQREPGSACFVDPRGIIQWVNGAWDRFARANGGAPAALGAMVVGTSWIRHVAGEEARAHYLALLDAALESSSWPGLVELGECNGPEVLRLVATRFERWVGEGQARPLGVLISSQVLTSRSVSGARPTAGGAVDAFRDPSGLLQQCWCCRAVREPAGNAWHFHPDLVRTLPPGVSFRLCPRCAALFGESLLALGTSPPQPQAALPLADRELEPQ